MFINQYMHCTCTNTSTNLNTRFFFSDLSLYPPHSLCLSMHMYEPSIPSSIGAGEAGGMEPGGGRGLTGASEGEGGMAAGEVVAAGAEAGPRTRRRGRGRARCGRRRGGEAVRGRGGRGRARWRSTATATARQSAVETGSLPASSTSSACASSARLGKRRRGNAHL